jgi:(E)-4-hydroxy-3-methylbut-2-enyl-diphosphate synthase
LNHAKELANHKIVEEKNQNAKFKTQNKFPIPIVIADFMLAETITHQDLQSIGYTYNEATDKWNIADAAADFIYTNNKILDFALPGTLNVLIDANAWHNSLDTEKYYPLYQGNEVLNDNSKFKIQNSKLNFITLDVSKNVDTIIDATKNNDTVVYAIYSNDSNGMQQCRAFARELANQNIHRPIIIAVESHHSSIDEQLIHFAQKAGALFLDGIGNGIWLMNDPSKIINQKVNGRTYLPVKNNHQFLNNTSFGILQATRKRISKTEYISCPSCGRTLFDLQETTAKIRNRTHHLKGVKIAIMGCIVNGPGEMADADFGYVGSGVGKITLYKNKDVVKKNIDSETAVDELINLLKESGAWVEKSN